MSRFRIWLPVAVLVLFAGAVIVEGLSAAKRTKAKPKTVLVSRQSANRGGLAADATSHRPKVSANGRFVAFTSEANNLGGNPNYDNAFLYDRKLRRLTFIARANAPGRDAADGDTYVDAISASGRFVAFSTDATNLGGPITLGVANVYVYDRKRNRISLVSRRSGRRGRGGSNHSLDAAISADGRHVAFATYADNLGGPAAGVANVYVYDRERRRARLVSRQSAGGPGGDSASGRPAISASGRHVAFETEADNLGGSIDSGVSNIYAYDIKRRRVALVSRQGPAAGGLGGNEDSNNASISADGRFVAFRTFADNLGGPIQTQSNIYLHDRRRSSLRLISRQPGPGGGGADAVSYHGSVSGDGRYVAFDSEATNLGGPITAGVGNVYLLDRKRNRLELVSRRSGRRGAGGDQGSFDPHISPSGRFIAFVSAADNLSAAAPGYPFASAYLRDRGR